MGEEHEECTFTLDYELEYAHNGESVKSNILILNEPTSKQIKWCAILHQAFFRALPKRNEDSGVKEDDKEVKLDGDEIMALISMSPDVDLDKVLVASREVLSSGLVQVGGEEKATKPILDQIKPVDFIRLTGVYMANFIVASVLQKRKKK